MKVDQQDKTIDEQASKIEELESRLYKAEVLIACMCTPCSLYCVYQYTCITSCALHLVGYLSALTVLQAVEDSLKTEIARRAKSRDDRDKSEKEHENEFQIAIVSEEIYQYCDSRSGIVHVYHHCVVTVLLIHIGYIDRVPSQSVWC